MKIIFILVSTLFLTSCATQKVLTATGGSKADGVIELSYEYNWLEKPIVNQTQGQSTAKQRCSAWGYTDAEPFGGSTQQCEQTDMYGACLRALVTVKYQCIGHGSQ